MPEQLEQLIIAFATPAVSAIISAVVAIVLARIRTDAELRKFKQEVLENYRGRLVEEKILSYRSIASAFYTLIQAIADAASAADGLEPDKRAALERLACAHQELLHAMGARTPVIHPELISAIKGVSNLGMEVTTALVQGTELPTDLHDRLSKAFRAVTNLMRSDIGMVLFEEGTVSDILVRYPRGR